MNEKRFNELRELKRRDEMRNFDSLSELGEFANMLCTRLETSESKLEAVRDYAEYRKDSSTCCRDLLKLLR